MSAASRDRGTPQGSARLPSGPCTAHLTIRGIALALPAEVDAEGRLRVRTAVVLAGPRTRSAVEVETADRRIALDVVEQGQSRDERGCLTTQIFAPWRPDAPATTRPRLRLAALLGGAEPTTDAEPEPSPAALDEEVAGSGSATGVAANAPVVKLDLSTHPPAVQACVRLNGRGAPSLTIDQALSARDAVYVFAGWDAYRAHPAFFERVMARPDRDVFVIDTRVSDTAYAVAEGLGADRCLFVRPGAEVELALSVAHAHLTHDGGRLTGVLADLARQHRFAPERVAGRIALEPRYASTISRAIHGLALRLGRCTPIVVSGAGRVAPHATWGALLQLVDRLGVGSDGTPRGALMHFEAADDVVGEVGSEPFVPSDDDLAWPEGPVVLPAPPRRAHLLRAAPRLAISATLAERAGLADGDEARVVLDGAELRLEVTVDRRVRGEVVFWQGTPARPLPGPVAIEIGRPRRLGFSTTALDVKQDAPVWRGETAVVLTERIAESADVTTFRFRADPPVRFAFDPGQFCRLTVEIGGQRLTRAYTIASSPTRPHTLDITVKRVAGGQVSNGIADTLQVGDRAAVSGPHGTFCLRPGAVPGRILLLAAGSGITPIMSMARWLVDVCADVDVRLLHGVRTADDTLFADELARLGAHRAFSRPPVVALSTGAGDEPFVGRVDRAMLEALAPDFREREVYLCGPAGFMEAVTGILRDAGYDLARLHTERFGGRPAPPRARIPRPMPTPSPTVTPQHSAARTAPRPVAPTRSTPEPDGHAVHFATSNRTLTAPAGAPLLDVAEARGVELPYGCRAGCCGACKVRLIEGEVDMAFDDGLDPDEKAAGFVLTCVAVPRTPCTLDA